MKAMQVMSALSQPVRLDVFIRLLSMLPAGMASGELASVTKIAPTAMSPHLAILSRAGLVKSTKVGRNMMYRAVPQPLGGLIEFLSEIHNKDLPDPLSHSDL